MSNYPGFQEREQTSKYNEAGLQIIRLHNYWVRAEMFANNGSFKRWKFQLDTIWRELYPDIRKNKSSKGWLSKNVIIKKRIAESKTPSMLYEALNDRHEFLKELQDLVGKGSRYGDVDDEDPE